MKEGKPWRVLSIGVMCSDACFKSISLASVLDIDCGWAREKVERPLKSYGDNPSERRQCPGPGW